MAINATHRQRVNRSLLPARSERLLDVGCGPITADYAYADKAAMVTCVDWKIRVVGSKPQNVEYIEGDFTKIDLQSDCYDSIVAADVFEHVLLEEETEFVRKCTSLLKPGGSMVVSVPHDGTFAWLDPYLVKPAIHRFLWRLGLYKRVHNGDCDIRKGHKHYRVEELVERFKPLQLSEVVYFGYFFDPLLSWGIALSRGEHFTGFGWLERACRTELNRDYGARSFNVAVKFYKPIGAR
jgi:2-polyprenyl-3-methyl-5-hydroxy-6-metoxy-1,4-benzoquinol methylase